MVRTKFRTVHAAEYRAAHRKSLKTDMRSLLAHWEEGRAYDRWGENHGDIALDVGISRSTVDAHVALFREFETTTDLNDAAEKFDCYSYQELVRLNRTGHHRVRSEAVYVWECCNCGSRDLKRVDP